MNAYASRQREDGAHLSPKYALYGVVEFPAKNFWSSEIRQRLMEFCCPVTLCLNLALMCEILLIPPRVRRTINPASLFFIPWFLLLTYTGQRCSFTSRGGAVSFWALASGQILYELRRGFRNPVNPRNQ